MRRLLGIQQQEFFRSLSGGREFHLNFNWVKVSSVWMFIVFGFYGWGTPTFSSLFSIPYLLVNIFIILVFSLYFFYGEHHTTKLRENFVIKSRQIYTVCGILLLQYVINLDWISRALTGDEVAYALQSQGQSYVLVKKILVIFPQLGDLPFRLLLQICSGGILLLFFFSVRLMYKIKSTRYFILLSFIGTIIFRVGAISQGGFNGSNPPGASFYYLIGSTILSPTNTSYRILSLLLASIFLTVIYEYLRKLLWLKEYIRVLIMFVLVSIPLFRHMSLIVEISIWSFYFATFILLQLFRSGGHVTYQQIFLCSIATTFRFPMISILIPMFFLAIFDAFRLHNEEERKSISRELILGGLLSLPGIIFVSTTRLVERFNRADLSEQEIDGPLVNVGRMAQDIFSTFEVTTHKITWVISTIGVIFFMRKSLAGFVLMSSYIAINFLLFFVLNTVDVAYVSKYIVEWFGPLVVIGLIAIVTKVPQTRKVNLLIAAILAGFVLTNVMDYNRIPSKFIFAESTVNSESSNDLSNIYRVVASAPFPYSETFNELGKDQNLSDCLNVGIVYGVYPQVMAGYTGTDVLKSLALVHKYLMAQDQLQESWLTSSNESITLSGSDCVIVGFVENKSVIVNELLENDWEIRKIVTDKTYRTNVFILTRKFQ